MACFLAAYLLIPAYYEQAGWGTELSWFAFSWTSYSGWDLLLKYAFLDYDSFLSAGIEIILPLSLLFIMWFDRKAHSSTNALGCLALSFALSAIHVYLLLPRLFASIPGYPNHIMTLVIQTYPIHTTFSVLFTLFAYKSWVDVKERKKNVKQPFSGTSAKAAGRQTRLEYKPCVECTTQLPLNAKFCDKCGTEQPE